MAPALRELMPKSIALRAEDDFDDAWVMLEQSYGSQQSGIPSVINSGLTLARWDGQTPVSAHRDHMKTLRTRLSAAGLTLSPIQFYQHFLNSLPAEYDWVTAVHDPISSNYSIDTLCAIELRRELRTTRDGGTSEDPVALLAKQKGSRGSERSESESESGLSGGINCREFRPL